MSGGRERIICHCFLNWLFCNIEQNRKSSQGIHSMLLMFTNLTYYKTGVPYANRWKSDSHDRSVTVFATVRILRSLPARTPLFMFQRYICYDLEVCNFCDGFYSSVRVYRTCMHVVIESNPDEINFFVSYMPCC